MSEGPIIPVVNKKERKLEVGDLVEYISDSVPPHDRDRLYDSYNKFGIITKIYILSYTKEEVTRVYWLDIERFGDCFLEELELVSACGGSSNI